MIEKLRFLGFGPFLAMAGYAQMGHFLAALDAQPQLEAWVPRIAFPSIEATAVDALNYTDLQASGSHDTGGCAGSHSIESLT
ncbi:MAG: hypothetical protein JRJ05_06935 [Deltaproteobacteria bacterium]|nr:hypothetical protein [Deltaproteobacteria bacterium]MBW2691483.1 hypothetical protein [Deltaproteobacteria bacterium]